MVREYNMPNKKDIEAALLYFIFDNSGAIKEFRDGEKTVNVLADTFNLTEKQKKAYLTTFYRKENRVKKSNLWHRLLFRAADSLASEKLISRPTQTLHLTNRREWMLTEEGYDKVIKMKGLPITEKDILPIKSFEVQKIVKRICTQERPINYNPVEKDKKSIKTEVEKKLRNRGFRQAIIQEYEFKCAICGLKIQSPNKTLWEVEAAHIVPHSMNGKDDIWNGVALCRLHHWALDVGWFTFGDDYKVIVSDKLNKLSPEFGMMGKYNFLTELTGDNRIIFLPKNKKSYPHKNAIKWHRDYFFNKIW